MYGNSNKEVTDYSEIFCEKDIYGRVSIKI